MKQHEKYCPLISGKCRTDCTWYVPEKEKIVYVHMEPHYRTYTEPASCRYKP